MNVLQLFVLLASLNPAKKTNFILLPDSTAQTTQKNDLVCQYYRDKIYKKSGNLAGNNSEQDIENSIEKFKNKGCYNNKSLPTIDKDLIKNLHENMKK